MSLSGTSRPYERLVDQSRVVSRSRHRSTRNEKLSVPEILAVRIPEILAGLRKETGDEDRERQGY